MATVAGLLLVLALVLAPRSGVVAQVLRRRRLAAAIVVARVACAPAMPTPAELADFMAATPAPI